MSDITDEEHEAKEATRELVKRARTIAVKNGDRWDCFDDATKAAICVMQYCDDQGIVAGISQRRRDAMIDAWAQLIREVLGLKL